MELTRDNIFERIKLGDVDSFELLFRKYYTRLCGFAYKYLNDYHLSEEIVQEAFFQLWEKREKLNIKVSLKSYLFKMIHNSCLNYQSHENVEAKYINFLKDFYSKHPSSGIDDHDTVIHNELKSAIDKAINSLPTECRKVFELSRFEGLKYKEIAEKLNISIKTVETQISIALKRLKRDLKEYLIVIISWLLIS